MKTLLYICCALIIARQAAAQHIRGVVRDAEGRQPLQGVLVVNAATQASAYSNDSGWYMVQATPGDTIVFMRASYQTERRIAVQGRPFEYVRMQPLFNVLDEVEILPEIEIWEREHKEMLRTYNKSFTDAKHKVKTSFYAGPLPGVTFYGLFTEMAARISGQKKKDKHFLRVFADAEEQKYIDLRYNPEVVMSTTGSSYDSAVSFIYRYPMEYAFAREATSLELLMWIRNNYRDWKEKSTTAQPGQKGKD